MTKAKIISVVIGSVLLVGAVVAGGFLINKQKELKKYKSIPLNLPDLFTYTAHTGCLDTDDNSLESIEVGVKNGAKIVEFDLHFTSDNKPVLSHDAPKGSEVTLDEAFAKISEYENLRVNVDLKSTANIEAIRPLAQKHGVLERIFFTGVNNEFLPSVRNQGIEYYLNVDVLPAKKHSEEYLLSLVQKVKESGAVGINFNKDNASKELVEVFHKNGFLVSIWTVDKEKDIYKILSFAPDNITTRHPDKFKLILGD